jgi:type 1 fimbria pilin
MKYLLKVMVFSLVVVANAWGYDGVINFQGTILDSHPHINIQDSYITSLSTSNLLLVKNVAYDYWSKGQSWDKTQNYEIKAMNDEVVQKGVIETETYL